MSYANRGTGYYSSPKEVVQYTGVKPEDLNVETEEELDVIIIGWLKFAFSFINENRGRNFEKELTDGKRDSIPELAHYIALQIAGNVYSMTQIRRQTNIMSINEYPVMVKDEIINSSILTQLNQLPKRSIFKSVLVSRKVSDL